MEGEKRDTEKAEELRGEDRGRRGNTEERENQEKLWAKLMGAGTEAKEEWRFRAKRRESDLGVQG